MHTNAGNKYKNPQLPEDLQDSGLRRKGGTNFATETFLQVNYRGVPVHRIDPEVYLMDVAKYWSLKEKPLWLIVAFGFLFLAMKLIS